MNYNINDITKYMDHFPFTREDDFSEEEIYEFLDKLDENTFELFDYNTGATKFVIKPCDFDYVIKIPFNYIERDSSDCCSTSGYNIYTYKDKLSFTGAKMNDGEWGWDYCALEEKIFKTAKKEGWDRFFTEIEQVREITQYPTYVQKRIRMYNTTNRKRSEEYLNRSKEICMSNRVRYSCPGWWADVLESFKGREENFLDFLDFLKEYNLDDDLHANNVGYDIETRFPVICDYGGFNEY